MPKNADPGEEKKTSRRRKPVVEEVETNTPAAAPEPSTPTVTPEPVQPPAPTPVMQPTPQPATETAAPDPTPQVEEIIPTTADAKAKQALSELEVAHSDHKKSKRGINLKLLFLLTMIVALVVGFVAGGLYVYTTGMDILNREEQPPASEENESPQPTQTPTPEPTATPTPVDVSEYSVSVLNGSGKAGEAGKVETLLEEAGFTVGNTGNASRYDYSSTVVQVREDVPQEVVAQIESALSENYTVEVGESLPENSTFDVVVTVGSDTN